jgi:hypothetical protein
MSVRFGALTRRSVLAALPGVVISPFAAADMSGETSAAEKGTLFTVSQELVNAICNHCAAYSEFSRISHQTDAVILGREPTAKEWRQSEKASARERDLFMRLCACPVSTDAERHAKASYLLAIFNGDELSSKR